MKQDIYVSAALNGSVCRVTRCADETSCYAEEGMLFRVQRVGPHDADLVFKVVLDFGAFADHNRKLESREGAKFAKNGTEECCDWDENDGFQFEALESEPLEAKYLRYEAALKEIVDLESDAAMTNAAFVVMALKSAQKALGLT